MQVSKGLLGLGKAEVAIGGEGVSEVVLC